MDAQVAHRRALVAAAHRTHKPPEIIAERRRDLAEAVLNVAIARALTVAPELTDEQVERLAARLRGVEA